MVIQLSLVIQLSSFYYYHSYCSLLLQKFGDDSTPGKRQKKALKYDTDEDEESMKSDSEADEQEDDYDSGKEKAKKKSSEVKESSSKKKTDRGSDHKSPSKIISKSPVKKASSKISEEKESPDGSAKVFSRKKKTTGKDENDIKEKKSSGKFVTVISIPKCSLSIDSWKFPVQFILPHWIIISGHTKATNHPSVFISFPGELLNTIMVSLFAIFYFHMD